MSRTMKIRKLKLFYFQKNARYRAKELCRNIFLGNLSLNEGKISVGLPVLILEFWWRHAKTNRELTNRRLLHVDAVGSRHSPESPSCRNFNLRFTVRRRRWCARGKFSRRFWSLFVWGFFNFLFTSRIQFKPKCLTSDKRELVLHTLIETA